ncbi:MAG: bifunctional adenosylcobinamide kinase/adenosylcobinamide-phosphate guanylyltransferase [Burkholderiales bacterium]|nr:bifunctional adenosylcobinamide kinase/adenosylcobinamide-phosphate guanylyltransferase [Burkholderiales bacterium]
MTPLTIAHSEFILGGQKSGKSRRAEALARAWLDQSNAHRAVLIATAQPWDDEMRERIQRHQQDRAQRVPGMATVEEPLALAEALARHSRPDTLVVVDCLTLWLTNLLMPCEVEQEQSTGGRATGRFAPCPPPATRAPPLPAQNAQSPSLLALVEPAKTAPLLIAITAAPGPLVLVGNEIGLGVIPMGREVRQFVDALGRLNQDVAGACQRVTLMAAGLPLYLKDQP